MTNLTTPQLRKTEGGTRPLPPIMTIFWPDLKKDTRFPIAD